MAPEGAVFVQTRFCHSDNILTTLDKIITRAGLVPLEKPMQNLRATRETDLLAHYPAKDLTNWLGNSPDVTNKHCEMTMQASFDRAVTDGSVIEGVTRKLESGVTKSLPTKLFRTLKDNLPLDEDTKKADQENPTSNWVCLQSALT
ncbi:MAG: integrase, partial [Planctomycetota bacterium]